MSSPLENELNAQFYAWEHRGRGQMIADTSVALEPPFQPFYGHFRRDKDIDDGRQHTFVSAFIEKWFSPKQELEPEPEPEEEKSPVELIREPVIELAVFFPATAHFKGDGFQAFFASLPQLAEPVSFEVFGNRKRLVMLFTASAGDLGRIKPLLASYFPTATFQVLPQQLETVWTGSGEKAVVEFGLGREFMLPLATGIPDPLVPLCGAFQGLGEDEVGVYQVLFQPTAHRWGESVLRSVSRHEGEPFFVNAPELLHEGQRKVAKPLYSVVVRLAAQSPDFDRSWEIVTNLAGALRLFQNPKGNELIPLPNEDYPYEDHVEDVLRRQSRRCGMLLNTEELAGFVHLPSAPSPIFSAGRRQSKAAPIFQLAAGSLVLGLNEHLGQSRPVILTQEQRFRHVHVIGATGTGKSTLLFNLIRQDIEQGHGVGVLDPHGDLIDRVLAIIPEDRRDDVIVFDPSDPDFTVGFNLLAAHSEAEKAILASDLVSVFERHSTSWGDQMNSVLHNAVLAFLESSRGGTLLDLRRFLLEPDFRAEFLTTVTNSEVLYYWQKAFHQLSGNKSLGSILTRLSTFLSPKPIRHALAMQHAKLDFGKVMDTGKIFLAKLPKGLIGQADTYLFGALLVGKFQQLAMARQSMAESQRRPFHLVIDEFQNFITPSLVEILNGARKYRLGLTLAHHELRQLAADKNVESALLANAGTRVVFRVGEADAKPLADGFADFEAADLSKLENFNAVCRIERSDQDFNLLVTPSAAPTLEQAVATREAVIARSREQFATSRVEIEELLRQQLAVTSKPKPEKAKPVKATPVPKVAAPIPEETPPKPDAEVPPPATSEVRQVTVEPPKPIAVVEPPKPVEPVVTPAHTGSEEKKAVMGRGGPQHQDIQQRLREGAQALGFHVTVEKPTPDKQGSVDLLLERGGQTIACEITVTTPIAHEVGNARKCLEAGYQLVVLVSPEESRLEKLKAATAELALAHPSKLHYHTPEQFLTWLGTLPVQSAKPEIRSSERNFRGYKVKSRGSALTDEERQRKESVALKVVGEVIKPKPV